MEWICAFLKDELTNIGLFSPSRFSKDAPCIFPESMTDSYGLLNFLCGAFGAHILPLAKKNESRTYAEPYKFVLDLDEGMLCFTDIVALSSFSLTELSSFFLFMLKFIILIS